MESRGLRGCFSERRFHRRRREESAGPGRGGRGRQPFDRVRRGEIFF